jgi:4-diphosphocytidyl-2-C-methyl-D-erythritol kinase
VSTPWVYGQLDLQLTEKNPNARVRPHFHVFSDVLDSLHNDLESVTTEAFPEISKIKDMLIQFGASGSLMSGSGPTVFGVFESSGVRDLAMKKISGLNVCWRVFAAEVLTA